MNDDILSGLQTVFDRVFTQKLGIHPELTALDVEEWDSVLHVNLLLEIEAEFGFRFRTGEAYRAVNVGDLVAIIATHLGHSDS